MPKGMIPNGDQRRWTAQDPTNSKACWRMIISCSMHVQGLKKDQIWRNMVVSIQYNGCLLVKPSCLRIKSTFLLLNFPFLLVVLSPFLLAKNHHFYYLSHYFCWQKITFLSISVAEKSPPLDCLKHQTPGSTRSTSSSEPSSAFWKNDRLKAASSTKNCLRSEGFVVA